MRNLGTFPFAANLEVQIKGMLDARMFCPSYADLLTFNPNIHKVFNGFITAVWDADETKRGVYQLVDENNPQIAQSWKNISSSSEIPANLQTLLNDFEARIGDLEADVAALYTQVSNASTSIDSLEVRVDNVEDGRAADNLRLNVVESNLSLKADLVAGKVPIAQIPLTQGVVRAYDDIADRDADTDLTGVIMALVIDPSADPDVEGSTDPRLYVNTSSGWVLYQDTSAAEAVLEWSNILNKPSSTVEEIDEAVFYTKSTYPITADLTVGGWNIGEALPPDSTWQDAIIKLVSKIFTPTFVNPSTSISLLNGSTQQPLNNLIEAGSIIYLLARIGFSRGSILGANQSGVWNPNAVQNPRSGIANNFTLRGVTNGSSERYFIDFPIALGSNEFTGYVAYNAGVQPFNSKNAPFGSPLPAGQTTSVTASIEGVYPLFAATVNITTATKQPLVSNQSANNIELNLVNESSGAKQFFDIPQSWVNTRGFAAINYFNTVSNQYDPTNKLADFTRTNIVQTIQGQSIPYYRYTYTGADRGAIKIKLIF